MNRIMGQWGAVMVFCLFCISCGGGGGGGNVGDTTAPTVDVSGTWSTVETVDGTACGDGTYGQTDAYVATQSGASLSVVPSSSGLTYTGTVAGNVISWTGSYPDNGGTTTITSLNLSVDELTENTFTGTANWSWTDGNTSCSGTTQIDGLRVAGPSSSTTTLTLGTPSAGTISSATQEDWFVFNATNGASYTIVLNGGDGSTADMDMYVYEGDQTSLLDWATTASSIEELTVTASATGPIYVKIKSFAPYYVSSTPYTLTATSL